MENTTPTLDTKERPVIGRKIIGFVIYAAWLTLFTLATNYMTVPPQLIHSGMWMITSIGGVVVGGQAFIDSIVPVAMKAADVMTAVKTSQTPK